MRRALLLGILLAGPVLARAQNQPSAGQITFTNTDQDPAGNYLNQAECSGPAGAHLVQLNWAIQVLPGLAPAQAGITYQLYASNKASTAGQACPIAPPDNTTSAVPVGQIINQSSLTLFNQPFDPTLIASALAVNGVTNPCTIANDTPIYLCVNASSGGQVFGVARGTMTLSTSRPAGSPALAVPIGPGNRALNPTWSYGGADAQWFRVQAISLADPGTLPTAAAFDPAGAFTGFDPRDPTRHFSGYVSGTTARITGLQNGVVYAVAVTGLTYAFNASDPSNVATGSPILVNDFWTVYKDDGGRETGGCATGAAGPVGLLLLAGALALTRRRK